MDSTDYRVTALLTEHLGFAPLTLVDEVINAVNQIMYNCTDALEAFLKKRRTVQLQELHGSDMDVDLDDDAEKSGKVFPLDEIHKGTAELETLLVSHVDKNFDKFELYTLRNILTLPKPLVEGGWVRLKHHQDLDLTKENASPPEMDANIRTLVRNINLELQLRKILQLHLAKARKIVKSLTRYKECIETTISTTSNSVLSPEIVALLRDNLTPINENVYYLLRQSDELVQQVIALNDKFMKSKTLDGLRGLQFNPSNRDVYIYEKSLKILNEIGVVESEGAPQPVLLSAYAQETKD